MSGIQRVDLNMAPRELVECANILRHEANVQSDIYNRARTLLSGLRGDWLGNTYDAYLNKFFEQEQIMRRYTELLREYANLLDSTAEEVVRMDNDAARSFSNLG